MSAKEHSAIICVFDARARILSVVFALLLALPALGALWTDHALRSRWENRPLAQAPALRDAVHATQFFESLERYLNDHFGFALYLNRIHRKLLFYVFGDSPSADIALGRDGFVFVTSFKSEPFSVLETLCVRGVDPALAKRAADSWTKALDRFAGAHRNVALIIVPSKPVLYSEKLGAAVPRRLREACAQYRLKDSVAGEIARSVTDAGYISIYPYTEFWRQRYDGNFYPRENFHYGGASAHWLGREVLKRLGIAPTAEYERGEEKRTVTPDLMNLLGFTRTLHAMDFPYEHFKITKHRNTPAFVRDYFPTVLQFDTYTSERPMSERTALLVGNSFTPSTALHLAPGYRSLTYIQVNELRKEMYEGFFLGLVPRIAADDLIFVYNDNVAASAAGGWVAELASDSGVR